MDEKVVQQIASEVSEKFLLPADLAARVVQFTLAQQAAYNLAKNPEGKVA